MTVPWTPDYGCCDDWDSYEPALQERATDLAWKSLRFLTGGRVGNPAVLVRPCRERCYPTAEGWAPHIRDGEWYNLDCCGRDVCGCTAVSEVVLRGEVAQINNVWVDGTLLGAADYRLDNGHRLVRIGGTWPVCQDITAAHNAAGAFAIEYVPGIIPSPAGLWAAGVLCCEFAKACTGQKCRLPTSVTSISRQGVSMEFSEGFFAGGNTGIREVDAYVVSINPKRLSNPPRVWSPDMRGNRYHSLPVGD